MATMSDTEIRRADVDDYSQLTGLVERFYEIDAHDFDPVRIESGLMPLLRDDKHGQVWVATAMFLETESPNEGARRFYRRHGFEADDSTWMSRELG